MRRTCTALFRGSLTLALPTVMLTGCPDDTSTTATGGESSETTESDSDPTGDPTTEPDPDSSETVDPDSSSSDPSTTEPTSTEPTTDTDPTTDTGEQCGNGGIDGAEECDGDELIGEDCESLGFDEGELACADDCTFDTSSCVMYSCGNDTVEGREICDGTDLAGADCVSEGFLEGDLACNADCLGFDTSACIANICSNDVIEGDELCDGSDVTSTCEVEGFDGGTLGCVDTCDAYDTSGCFVCGDGEVGGTEECDGDIGAATCESLGFDGGSLSCSNSCTYDTSQCFACGDGVLNGEETCDSQDFASPTICVDGGFDGGSPTCSADCSTVTTGSCFGEHIFCNDTDLAIGPGEGTLTQSDIAVAGLAGQITDVDVFMNGTHTFVGDLDSVVTYVDPNLAVGLVSDDCGGSDNFDVTWDDEGVVLACGVNPAFSGATIPPDGNLASYEGVGLDGNGTWRLQITDDENGDAGSLNNWCVEITTGPVASTNCVVDTALFPLFVHPSNHFGDFDFDADCNIQVSGAFNFSLYEVDGVTGAVTERVAGLPGIQAVVGVAYRASNDTTYLATDNTARLFAVAADDSVVEVMVLPTLMNSISLVPEGFGAFGGQLVGSGLDGAVWIINPDTASAVSLVNIGDNILSDVAIDPSTNVGYAVTQNGNVRTFDAAGGTALLVGGLFGIDGIAIEPGVAAFVADSNNQQVIEIDLANLGQFNYVGFSFDGGYYTSGIAVDGAGNVVVKVSGANLDVIVPN